MMVLEAEQELRQLERELREIDALDSRGIVGAGQLGGTHSAAEQAMLPDPVILADSLLELGAEHATLRPQLGELQTAEAPLATGYGHLDDQANALLGRYNDYVSPKSRWSDFADSIWLLRLVFVLVSDF